MVRELAREHRVVGFRLMISDHPGVLGDIAATIGAKGGNILEVLHHRTMLRVPPKWASIDLTIETHGPEHAGEIAEALTAKGYLVELLDPAGDGQLMPPALYREVLTLILPPWGKPKARGQQ